jgi:NAD(P)-dependent dehydrogenase (short-subunit alcohol dehydrogenase family)
MTAFTSATSTATSTATSSAAPSATARPGRLAGRRALITGASRGIGRAIALRYADEGAELFLTATSMAGLDETRALAEARGARVAVHAVDVSDRTAVQLMVAAAVAAMGGIDVLVNNAGVYHAAPLLDCEPEDFDRVMQVNLYGAFHVMQWVLRQMRDQVNAPSRDPADGRGLGKVVNMASTAGKWASMNQSAYNASKHALVGLTRCAAVELGGLGICVNAICPGFVETDMLESFRAHAVIQGVPFEQIMANGKARVPLKRFLQPEEIAHLTVYLGSHESDGMTGQSILLDGGMLVV